MSRIPLIRNGRLYGSPLAGIDNPDLNQLDEKQLRDMQQVVSKGKNGHAMSSADLATVISSRETARATAKVQPTVAQGNTDTLSQVAESIRQLKAVFS